MKLTISVVLFLLGLSVLVWPAHSARTLSSEECSAFAAGQTGGQGDWYLDCVNHGASCRDCISQTKCEKFLTLWECDLVQSETPQSCTIVTVDCGRLAHFPRAGCQGHPTVGGQCDDISCQ